MDFLQLRTLDSLSALHLGAILKSEITNKAQKCKKGGTDRPLKGL